MPTRNAEYSDEPNLEVTVNDGAKPTFIATIPGSKRAKTKQRNAEYSDEPNLEVPVNDGAKPTFIATLSGAKTKRKKSEKCWRTILIN